MEIVRLRPEHVSHFRKLVASILPEFGFREDTEIDADLADPLGHYDAVWVAVENGAIVGSVAMRRLSGGAVELKRMYVHADQRGRGLGRRLLETALEWARAERAQRVVLDTTEEMRAARHLYVQAGFHRTGSRVERGAVDSRCEILYALELGGREPGQPVES